MQFGNKFNGFGGGGRGDQRMIRTSEEVIEVLWQRKTQLLRKHGQLERRNLELEEENRVMTRRLRLLMEHKEKMRRMREEEAERELPGMEVNLEEAGSEEPGDVVEGQDSGGHQHDLELDGPAADDQDEVEVQVELTQVPASSRGTFPDLRKFTCKRCGKKYQSRRAGYKHRVNVHGFKPFKALKAVK